MNPFVILAAGMIVVMGSILAFRMHAFLALVLGAFVVGALTSPENIAAYARNEAENDARKQKLAGKTIDVEARSADIAKKLDKQSVAERIAEGFGKTCTGIGLLIALASIVGKCALDSGSADRIVRTSLRILGEARAPLAFLGSGFLLGIPVFFDTVFFLMLPLGKAMAMRTGRNYLLYVLAIGAGATMTHSLVPPTPGPLVAAEILGVNLGKMIIGGCLVGAVTAAVGYAFAKWVNARWQVPLRDTAGVSLDELKKLSERDASELPPFWLAMAPILLPVLLITGAETLKELPTLGVPDWFRSTILVLGEKNVSMLIAAGIALATLGWKRKMTKKELSAAVETSLLEAGTVILITAAGGAFGATLQQTGIGEGLRLSTGASLWMIPLAFGVTSLIRTAQGSATVAMITAAGVFASASNAETLGFDPVYLALAVGCGSKPIAWMNDSGFWVVCRMSGMTEGEALRFWSPLTGVMGVTGLITTVLAAWLWPGV